MESNSNMGPGRKMRLHALVLAMVWAIAPAGGKLPAQSDPLLDLQPQAEQLFALANQSRAAQGLAPLKWDSDLAAAALLHCRRMAAEGEIAHRYGGEADLSERAGKAGAHFSLIEENVALGSYVDRIHQGWMDSPGHRANILNPGVDHVGIAVVASAGVYFAVADYTRGVAVMSQTQVEAAVAGLIRKSGVAVVKDPALARNTCAIDHGLPGAIGGPNPEFIMRWQNADLNQLPADLRSKLESGKYREAAVGSCAPKDVEGDFTVYRLAVLLYSAQAVSPRPFYQP